MIVTGSADQVKFWLGIAALFASPVDDVPTINAVFCEVKDSQLQLTATDRYVVATASPPLAVAGAARSFLISLRDIKAVCSLFHGDAPLRLTVGRTQAVWRSGNSRYGHELVWGEFPDYRKIYAKQDPGHRARPDLCLGFPLGQISDAYQRLSAREHAPLRLSTRGAGQNDPIFFTVGERLRGAVIPVLT